MKTNYYQSQKFWTRNSTNKQIEHQQEKINIFGKAMMAIKSIVTCFDEWKCQFMMINRLALWLDDHTIFEKSLQIIATVVSFSTLILSILTLTGKQEIQMYFPIYNHFLLSYQQFLNPSSFQQLSQQCHYFNDLKMVKFIGYNKMTFYSIRIVILFILFVSDMLGLFFAFVHPPCGTKMYVFGLGVTLLFFVLFPSELCINFGQKCIEQSPIFLFYRIEFMIQFNVAWLGLGSILLILIIVPLTSCISKNYNICGLGRIFYEIIYGIACVPYVGFALINFITALFTSSALINVLTFIGLIINFLLYHAGTDIRDQYEQKQRQIEKVLQQEQMQENKQDKQNFNGYYDYGNELQITDNINAEKYFITLNSPQKHERMKFYKDWQDRLYQQFHQP